MPDTIEERDIVLGRDIITYTEFLQS